MHRLLIFPLLLLAGCDKSDTSSPATKPAPPTTVTTTQPRPGDVIRSITQPGNVRPLQEATLYAKVPGYLRAIHADIGDTIEKGTLLAEIEAPEMLADRVMLVTELAVAEKELRRLTDAREKARDLVMPQTVDEAQGRFDVKKAQLDRLDTLLAYARITAPFTGVITARHADPGAFISAAAGSSSTENSALFHLADFHRVRIEIDVPEIEVPLLKTGLTARVKTPSGGLTGTVTRIGYALDPRTKTMKAEVELENPDLALHPGMMVSVAIDLEKRTQVLLVPAAVLIVKKGKASVFIVRDGKAIKTSVQTGFDDGISVEITGGLQATDTLILGGKEKVTDGKPVTAQPSTQS